MRDRPRPADIGMQHSGYGLKPAPQYRAAASRC